MHRNRNLRPWQENKSIPGIPGMASSDNIAAGVITLNCLRIDPLASTATTVSRDFAESPRDAIALQLGEFNGDRGAADTLFSVVTEKGRSFRPPHLV